MQPNELGNAMKVEEKDREKMALFGARIHGTLELYQRGLASFALNPRDYDPTFNANLLSLKPGHAQDRYFGRISNMFMRFAMQAVETGEDFHTKENMAAAMKMQAAQVTIPGVQLPDLGEETLKSLCECGHPFGNHLDGLEGPCFNRTCKCRGFTPKKKEGAE